MTTLSIGRSHDNDIVYNEPSLSGNHATLQIYDDGRIFITDHSTNGTMVNGNLLHNGTAQVAYGESIVFPGNTVFDWNAVFGNQAAGGGTGTVVGGAAYSAQAVNSGMSGKAARTRSYQRKMFSGLFSFEGRIRRLEYGLTLIILTVASSLVGLLLGLLAANGIGNGSTVGLVIAIILGLAWSVASIWVSLAQAAKRCHDINLSGWFQVLMNMSIVLIFLDGSKGDNDFGPSPKA